MLDAFEADLRRVFDGTPVHPLLTALRPTVQRHRLTPEPFLGLIAANRQDQQVSRYATYDDLLAYCELSANPVGRLVLSITGTSTPERVRRSDAVCTALQIVEHLQDVVEDLGRDRVYLPAEDMKRFSVDEADLAAPSAGRRCANWSRSKPGGPVTCWARAVPWSVASVAGSDCCSPDSSAAAARHCGRWRTRGTTCWRVPPRPPNPSCCVRWGRHCEERGDPDRERFRAHVRTGACCIQVL